MSDATPACRKRPFAAAVDPRVSPIRLAPVLLALVLAGAAGLGPIGATARADETSQVRALASSGHIAQAQTQLDKLIAAHPNDPQYRFLRGVLLSEQHKTGEAIQVFTQITEQFPELPEPYNNLAVLYAQQGNYDKARAALEMAIRTNPSYATAFENLGDVYAKLASQSYQKALQLDGGSAGATQAKLALIRQLFTSETQRAPARVAMAEPAVKPVAQTPPAAEAKPAAQAKPVVEAKPAPSSKPTAPARPAPVNKAVVEARTATPAKPAAGALAEPSAHAPAASDATHASAGMDEQRAVERAVLAWAHAWQSRDLQAYFGSYTHDFKPGGGVGHAAWVAQRKARIGDKHQIKVAVEQLRVEVDGDRAVAHFRQLYSAGNLHFNSLKTLRLRRFGQHWLIVQESVG